MAPAPDPDRFKVGSRALSTGVRIAYIREGVGGYPLVLLHGYPETKRIWWRNIEALARAGFEVIAPDLRGYGESSMAPDGYYDLAACSGDVFALVHEELGHDRCAVVAGDLGGAIAIDLALRFDDFVERQVIFNTILPVLGERYRAAGIPADPPRSDRPESDYFVRQGGDAEGLLAELSTPELRRRYVTSFYRERRWAAPGSFSFEDARFMAEPFDDAERLRASWGPYEAALGTRPVSAEPRWREAVTIPTLVLYGREDRVISPHFPARARVCFEECTGPFALVGCGHFVQWERAELLNSAARHFLGADPDPARFDPC